MIKRILVPLDGSELSERAIPWACEIAQGVGASLILLGIVPPPSGRWGGLFRSVAEFAPELPESEADLDRILHPVSKDSQMASDESEVKRALLPIADRIKAQQVEVTVVVGFGRPVEGILQHVASDNIDMIIMSTHGHHGLHPYAYGSTADRVARHSPVPVMLVRPQEVAHMLPLPKILGGA